MRANISTLLFHDSMGMYYERIAPQTAAASLI